MRGQFRLDRLTLEIRSDELQHSMPVGQGGPERADLRPQLERLSDRMAIQSTQFAGVPPRTEGGFGPFQAPDHAFELSHGGGPVRRLDGECRSRPHQIQRALDADRAGGGDWI